MELKVKEKILLLVSIKSRKSTDNSRILPRPVHILKIKSVLIPHRWVDSLNIKRKFITTLEILLTSLLMKLRPIS